MWRADASPTWWTWVNFERAVKLLLGVALVWHQGVIASSFNPYVFTGGLTLLGVTEAIRWDLARRVGSSPDGRQPSASDPPGVSPSRSPTS